MVAGDAIDRAVGDRRGDGTAIGFAAQRRRQLGEGAIVADLVLVEREIRRRGVAGDMQAARLGPRDRRDRRRGRDMGDVVARTGHRHEMEIALDQYDLGRGRNAGQPEPGGELAAVHRAAGGEARLLRVLD